MKKIRLLALIVILTAVIANGYAKPSELACDLQCDSRNNAALCDNGVDTGCDAFCQSSFQCEYYGFTSVYGECDAAPSHWCVCRGCL